MSVLDTIHRIRKYHEQTARVELREAEGEAAALERRLADTIGQVERAHAGQRHEDADDLSRRHAFRLQMEMRRRAEAQQVEQGQAKVSERRGVVVQRATEARVMERLVETRAEAVLRDLEVANRTFLDEVGAQGWLRKRGAGS
ncbi:MAG: hypothetical protein JXX28_12370 [Deltaproteobacteria bacterium]|nr:hypothetical protein [Deltaproteobacteria bacterium]